MLTYYLFHFSSSFCTSFIFTWFFSTPFIYLHMLIFPSYKKGFFFVFLSYIFPHLCNRSFCLCIIHIIPWKAYEAWSSSLYIRWRLISRELFIFLWPGVALLMQLLSLFEIALNYHLVQKFVPPPLHTPKTFHCFASHWLNCTLLKNNNKMLVYSATKTTV